jgi:hypothetical protein
MLFRGGLFYVFYSETAWTQKYKNNGSFYAKITNRRVENIKSPLDDL